MSPVRPGAHAVQAVGSGSGDSSSKFAVDACDYRLTYEKSKSLRLSLSPGLARV